MTNPLTTLTLVRQRSGVSITLLGDTDAQAIIDQSEALVNETFDARFVPTTQIEIFSGDRTNRRKLTKTPVLRIKSISINGTSIDPTSTYIEEGDSALFLKGTATRYTFDDSDRGTNAIVYDYGLLETDFSVVTKTTTNAEAAGSAVVIEMASTTGLTAGDYVRIAGTDFFDEVATISSVSANVSVIVDSLSYSHAAGSTVWRMQTPAVIKQYATVVAAIAILANVMGSTYGNVKQYSLEGLSVTKGDPMEYFMKTTLQLIAERDAIGKTIRQRPTVA